jgi:hypothetical protein
MISRLDSWPPTQVRLNPFLPSKDDPRPLLDDIDDDPLIFFLTPAPGLEDEDVDSSMMQFDAGIEDASSPRDIVRSVSPSTLGGLSKPKGRPASPGFDSDVPSTDDEEDDDEDYITSHNFKLLTLSEFAIDGPKLRSRPKSPVHSRPTNALPSRASFPGPSYRGRTGLRGRPPPFRSLSVRARPNHLWREPSPDVWSIEEETEEEIMSEMGNSVISRSDAGEEIIHMKDLRNTAKPGKKVRFVLPVKE